MLGDLHPHVYDVDGVCDCSVFGLKLLILTFLSVLIVMFLIVTFLFIRGALAEI